MDDNRRNSGLTLKSGLGCNWKTVLRKLHAGMAKSKFEYVRGFELSDQLLPNCWIVVRVDGKGFHRFSDVHKFVKPNDERGLSLMNKAAEKIMKEFSEIFVAYGQSDEFSFIFNKNTNLYNRRSSKLMTTISSMFSSNYTYHWKEFFTEQELLYPPAFDARCVLYPDNNTLRDYLSWRQADCHVNNLYNTCFWNLVQLKGLSNKQAEKELRGTYASDKNELLFSQFNINYNDLPQIYRKGSFLMREKYENTVLVTRPKGGMKGAELVEEEVTAVRSRINTLHTDIISDSFWDDHPELLQDKR